MNFPAIVALGVVTAMIFTIKGAATYGSAVMLSQIGNRIVAENQRRCSTSCSTRISAFSPTGTLRNSSHG